MNPWKPLLHNDEAFKSNFISIELTTALNVRQEREKAKTYKLGNYTCHRIRQSRSILRIAYTYNFNMKK